MYKDSPDNFIIDGGSLQAGEVTLSEVIYDDQQSHAVVNGDFCDKPIKAIEDKIAAIDSYIAAKAAREYVPPTLEELREQALNYQYQKYDAQKHAVVWLLMLKSMLSYGYKTAAATASIVMTMIRTTGRLL